MDSATRSYLQFHHQLPCSRVGGRHYVRGGFKKDIPPSESRAVVDRILRQRLGERLHLLKDIREFLLSGHRFLARGDERLAVWLLALFVDELLAGRTRPS